MINSKVVSAFVCAAFVALAGCSSDPAQLVDRAMLALPFSEVGMYPGEQLDVLVTARSGSGAILPDVIVEWTSSDPDVVAVTPAGRVFALAAGSALVVVSSDCCLSDTLNVSVELGRVEASPATVIFVQPGQSMELSATARRLTGQAIPDADLTWTSSDIGVAAVNGTGLVSAQSVGTALIVVAAACCSSDTVVFNVEEPGEPPEGLLLAVDWGTATGNGLAAVTDGGKAIDPRYCQWSNILSVVPGGPVGWARTANVLAIQSIPNGCGHVEFEHVFPRPTDGQQQFWAVRYYMMNGVGQTDTKQHPHCFWPVGAIEAVHTIIHTVSGGNGDWYHGSVWTGPLFPWYAMIGPTHLPSDRRVLTAGTWYRYEFIMHWVNATQFRVYPRLYDMAGNLLNDYTTWRHSDGAGTLQQYYADGNFFTRTPASSGIDNIRTISFGMGQSGSASGYYYVADAAFALVAGIDDYIGN